MTLVMSDWAIYDLKQRKSLLIHNSGPLQIRLGYFPLLPLLCLLVRDLLCMWGGWKKKTSILDPCRGFNFPLEAQQADRPSLSLGSSLLSLHDVTLLKGINTSTQLWLTGPSDPPSKAKIWVGLSPLTVCGSEVFSIDIPTGWSLGLCINKVLDVCVSFPGWCGRRKWRKWYFAAFSHSSGRTPHPSSSTTYHLLNLSLSTPARHLM